MTTGERRYCVLYIRCVDQERLKNLLLLGPVGERSDVFYPTMEYYWRNEKQVKVRPIFPGYVFVYTDMGNMEIHNHLLSLRKYEQLPFSELKLKEGIMFGDGIWLDRDQDDEIFFLTELNPEEKAYMDILRENNGLLGMSRGYQEGRRYVVMEGPLKVFQDNIEKVDKHNRKAFLSFSINGRKAQAGFECKPKVYWFPHGDEELVTLTDGSEIDLEELRKKMQ